MLFRSALLTEQGTFVDDLVVYRLRRDHFLLVVNAANIVKDYTWIAERIATYGDTVVMDGNGLDEVQAGLPYYEMERTL